MRVGIDLVAVRSVRDALDAAHGARYLERVYTAAEVRDCGGEGGVGAVDPERLAARFAAKEAAMKVLRPGDRGVAWREIEVRRADGGDVFLALGGRAAALAEQAGLAELAVSLTHEDGLAAAVVVAEVAAPGR